MKKSLNYGTVAALAILLAFAACEQATDSGGGSGGVIPSYQSDVDSIAIAFADGAPTVYLKQDLQIGMGELVVPEGKTIDLTDMGRSNLTLTGFKEQGKLVILGNFVFGNKEIRMDGTGAKLIARNSYIESNVNVIRDGEEYVPNANKRIVADENNIILVADFDMASEDAWKNIVFKKNGADYDPEYIAVAYSGTINEAIADNISKFASGRRLYIIGNTVFSAKVGIKAGKEYIPPAPVTGSSRHTVFTDADGSLVVAGNARFDQGGDVSTANGFTVFGMLTTGAGRGDEKIVSGGEFSAYAMAVDGGAAFEDNVYLLSRVIGSNLGMSAQFTKNFTANGPVTVTAIEAGTASFERNVEFKGADDQVKIKYIIFNGDVTINTDTDSFDIYNTTNRTIKDSFEGTVTYELDYKRGTESAIDLKYPTIFKKSVTFGANQPVAGTNVTFMGPVVMDGVVQFARGGGSEAVIFKDTATFGSIAVEFNNVTFEKEVKFKSTDSSNTKFSGNTFFERAVTFGLNGDASFEIGSGTQVVFKDEIKPLFNITEMNGAVTFAKDFETDSVVTFGSNSVFNGKAYFGSQATFNSGTETVTFNKEVTFARDVTIYGKADFNNTVSLSRSILFHFGGTVTYNDGIKGKIELVPGGATTGTISNSASPVSFNDGYIVVNAGTLASADAFTIKANKVTFSNGGLKINPTSTTGGSVVANIAGTLDFEGYSVITTGGSLAATNSVVFANKAIEIPSDGVGGAEIVLTNVGTFTVNLKNDFTLAKVKLNMPLGTISTTNPAKNPITLTLTGGTAAIVSGADSAGMLSVGNAVAGKSIVGGTLAGITGQAPLGVLLIDGRVYGPDAGFVTDGGVNNSGSPDGGTIGLLGYAPATYITPDSGFASFYNKQDSIESAWTNVKGKVYETAIYGGSIAVFTINDTPAPTPTPPESRR